MIAKMKAKIIIAFVFVSLFIFSLILIKHTQINIALFVDNSFLFTYLGIFLGFAITIFTFIVSMIEKIRDRIEINPHKTDEEKGKIEKDIINLYKEIKQNIMLIFYSFLTVILIALIGSIDLPFISISPKLGLTKHDIFCAIKLEILFLSLYSIYDLTTSSFTVSNLTGLINSKTKTITKDGSLKS